MLELARERLATGSTYLTSDIHKLEVIERDFTMLEIEQAWKEGRIVEAFLSGTAVSFFFLFQSIWLFLLMPVSTSSPQFLLLISEIRRSISLWEMARADIMLLS